MAAVGVTSGSVSALLLRLISETLRSPTAFPECPDCPDFECPAALLSDLLPALEHLHLPSICIGVLIGLAIGPVLDLCFLARQTWKAWIRSRLVSVARKQFRSQNLYKLA